MANQMTDTQREALEAYREHGNNYQAAADALNKSRRTIRELVAKALKWEEISESPGLAKALHTTGLDGAVVEGGWRITQETLPDGTVVRNSVRYRLKGVQDSTPIDVAQAITESLKTVIPMALIQGPNDKLPAEICNFIPLADLHVGGEYGDPEYKPTVIAAIERLILGLPKASKAVLLDMGDLLDANDHKGLTPASMNECDVIRENHLKNTLDALDIMRYAATRLAETHDEVEVHLLRGNHDETAYIGVMVGLHEYFRDNPRVNIVMTDDDFRVIPWGKCAVFPHHGDKAKWEDLKSVFSDQFCDAWAAAKYWRFIWTAHVHHDKQREMIGAVGEHFRTLAAPNRWAQLKGLFSRGGIQAITLHKEFGETDRKKVNLQPLLLQDK